MEIKIDGRLLVSTLCARFKEEFGGTLRVYQGNKRLTGAEKVSEVATKTGSYECRGSKTVGGFEKDMMTNFGLKVQVAKEREAKKKDNERYAALAKNAGTPSSKASYRKQKIDRATAHDRRIESLKREIERTNVALKRERERAKKKK